jgi:DNA-binding NarL/FixJ family response regulator
VERFVQGPPPGGNPAALDGLTEREVEVLRLVGRGLSNAEIASRVFLAPETVKTHVKAILGKLGVRDRTQAVVWAYRTGFVGAED